MTMTIAAISAAVLPKINGTAAIVLASEATTVLVGMSSPVRVGGVAWLSFAPSIGASRRCIVDTPLLMMIAMLGKG